MNKLPFLFATLALLLASVLPASAFAQSAACKTSARYPHSIVQTCANGSTQEVFFPADVSGGGFDIQIVSSSGAKSTGTPYGPWLIWTDGSGARCATPDIGAPTDFYPITCPPDGIAAI